MNKTRLISIGGLFMAIIIMMSLIPMLGYIQLPGVAITLIHIPVLIMAMSFKNWKLALVAGATFGVSSWFVAMTRPAGPLDVIFQNPLVSVVPRILFALLAYLIYKELSKAMKNDYLACLIATIIACIFHTVAVLFMMYSFGQELFPNGFIDLLLLVAGSNGVIEVIIAAIIVPPVARALNKFNNVL